MRVRETGWRWALVGALATTSSLGACGGHSTREPAEPVEPTGAGAGGGAPGEAPLESPAECVPYEDTCAPGRYCQYVDGRTQCVAEGVVARDAGCNGGGRCQRGSICLYGSEFYGDSCQQPCSLDGRYKCFIGRHTCFVAQGPEGEALSFGVCRYSE
jgi:hypothetical protein